jgi:hypothetical protein
MRELTVKSCSNKTRLIHLVESCPALRSLTVRLTDFDPDEQQSTESVFDALASNCKSLEEFSLDSNVRCYNDGSLLPHDFYTQFAAALVQLLRRCAMLKKVSLMGDTLRGVKLEELLPLAICFVDWSSIVMQCFPLLGKQSRTFSLAAST